MLISNSQKTNKIKTIPRKRAKLSSGFNPRKKRRNQLLMSVVAAYLLIGSVFGFFFFNSQGSNTASADETAFVASSIRFVEEKDYNLGDTIQVAVTLQNTSIKESINAIQLQLLSSKDSIIWEKAESRTNLTSRGIEPNDQKAFDLPPLIAGERAEYIVSGSVKDTSTNYLITLGKVTFQNKVGNQEVKTNRISTNLSFIELDNYKALVLITDKESYSPGENVTLTLSKPSPEDQFIPLDINLKGKIYISKRKTGEIVQTFDCIPGENGICQLLVKDLEAGDYSAIFLDETEQIFSEVTWFNITGQTETGQFIPNTETQIEIPLGNTSVNGSVPVIAKRVLSQNEVVKEGSVCTFQIWLEKKVVYETNAKVTSNRTCETTIFTTNLPQEGVFRVGLKNSDITEVVSFLPKGEALMEIQNISGKISKDQDLEIKIEGINDENNLPVVSEKLTLFIYHQNSGNLEEINSLKGLDLEVKDGQFSTIVPGEFFTESGRYLIYTKLASGRLSEFLDLSLANNELAFSRSGVITDYSKLNVDNSINFRLEGVTDRDENLIQEGTCGANFYGRQNPNEPLQVSGNITDGTCLVTLPQGEITKSGPLLVDFGGENLSNPISQSKQFLLNSGIARDFGSLSLEYEPARVNFANNLIIGPIIDGYNNQTEANDLKIVVLDEGLKPIKEIKNINAEKGFAEVFLPSSLFKGKAITIQLFDSELNKLIEREIGLIEEDSSLILPSIPDVLKGDENLILGANNQIKDKPIVEESNQSSSESSNESAEVESQTESSQTASQAKVFCKAIFFQTQEIFIEKDFLYDLEADKCELNWDLNKFRDDDKGLVQIQVADQKYSGVVKIESGSASNLFVVSSQIRNNNKSELEVKLLTSPLVDKHGKVVKEDVLKWQFNGKIEELPISDGFSNLPITANKLENNDISKNLDLRFLDLDLDISTGLSAVNKTNNLKIFIGNYDIANDFPTFEINRASDYISNQYSKIFEFQSEVCEAFILNIQQEIIPAKTHRQGNRCFVEINASKGRNSLIFEQEGFTLTHFDFTANEASEEINWCAGNVDNKTMCDTIQVLSPSTSIIEATIFDGQNEYVIQGGELENTIKLQQNGLNPLKEYLVRVSYNNLDGKRINHYNRVLGEIMIPK